MEIGARAELIADGGEAASSEEFFRCRPYLAAERTTHSLRIETADGHLVAPLIVREVPGDAGRDAVSPYGYPGIVAAEGTAAAELDPDDIDWAATELVSVFVRGTALAARPLAAVERGTLQISDPREKLKSRMSDRQQIRRNEAAGYRTEVVAGPEADEEARASFNRAYEETMVRTGADARYFFDRAWLDATLSSPRSWLVSVRAPDGELAAGSICALSDGVLHYFLSGTADEHLREAPMKNVISALQALSEELVLPLNLGGGLQPGDGLEEFKRGFANRQEPFVTHEVICDQPAYERLAAGRDAGGFFPAYRAPKPDLEG